MKYRYLVKYSYSAFLLFRRRAWVELETGRKVRSLKDLRSLSELLRRKHGIGRVFIEDFRLAAAVSAEGS